MQIYILINFFKLFKFRKFKKNTENIFMYNHVTKISLT